MKKIEIIVEKTKTGFSASTVKYPVYTAAKNIQELKLNMVEAVNLYFDHNNKEIISAENIKLQLDLPSFFKFYKIINAKAFSERIGMHQSLLAAYIKGSKKPSATQTKRILNGVHAIGKELQEIDF